jgi:hypothetical protein
MRTRLCEVGYVRQAHRRCTIGWFMFEVSLEWDEVSRKSAPDRVKLTP